MTSSDALMCILFVLFCFVFFFFFFFFNIFCFSCISDAFLFNFDFDFVFFFLLFFYPIIYLFYLIFKIFTYSYLTNYACHKLINHKSYRCTPQLFQKHFYQLTDHGPFISTINPSHSNIKMIPQGLKSLIHHHYSLKTHVIQYLVIQRLSY